MNDYNKKIVEELIIRTSQGELTWSCYEVLELEKSAKDKEFELQVAQSAVNAINREIDSKTEKMALKGWREERILSNLKDKFVSLNFRKKRIKYLNKEARRIRKRIKEFKPVNVGKWYFLYSQNRYAKKNIVLVERNDYGYTYTCTNDRNHVLNHFTSEEYPKLITLGMILNIGKSVVVKADYSEFGDETI